jgi:hypothetical protein
MFFNPGPLILSCNLMTEQLYYSQAKVGGSDGDVEAAGGGGGGVDVVSHSLCPMWTSSPHLKITPTPSHPLAEKQKTWPPPRLRRRW